jgi:sortase A
MDGVALVTRLGRQPRRRPAALALAALVALTACGTGDTAVTADVLEPVPAQARAAREAEQIVVTVPPVPTTLTPTTAPPALDGATGEADATGSPDAISIAALEESLASDAAPTDVAPVPSPGDLPVPQPPPDPNSDAETPPLFRIRIPKIGLDQTVFDGVTKKALDDGPGHWPGTARPGEVGNMVIAGHRTSHTRPFVDLDLLVPGDEVVFGEDGDAVTYRVMRTEIVPPDALWITDPTPDATATLFACHPKGSTRERIVVRLAHAPVEEPAPVTPTP